MHVAGDVGNPDDAAAIVAAVIATLDDGGLVGVDSGGIDLLVHCAGIAEPCDPDKVDWARWRRTMTTNLDGTYNMIYAVKDGMVKRQYGRIVTISSVAALRQRAWNMPYSVSKAAVIALTKCCAEAWGHAGVRVNCIAPGVIESEMLHGNGEEGAEQYARLMAMAKQQALSSRGVGQPSEIASTAKFLLSDDSSFMTGQTLVVDGGRMMVP